MRSLFVKNWKDKFLADTQRNTNFICISFYMYEIMPDKSRDARCHDNRCCEWFLYGVYWLSSHHTRLKNKNPFRCGVCMMQTLKSNFQTVKCHQTFFSKILLWYYTWRKAFDYWKINLFICSGVNQLFQHFRRRNALPLKGLRYNYTHHKKFKFYYYFF